MKKKTMTPKAFAVAFAVKSTSAKKAKSSVMAPTRAKKAGNSGNMQARLAAKAGVKKSDDVKVTTLRMPAPLHQRLEVLQGVLQVTLNGLINEALGEFVARRTAEIEVDMTRVLERIRRVRAADPDYEHAIASYVDAEAKYGKEDLVEGKVKTKAMPARRTGSLVQRLLARG